MIEVFGAGLPMTKSSSPASPEREESGIVPSSLNFPIIGVGASAGGLEALLRLLENIPAHSGMAFVIVLHLSPRHESSAAEILQRATAMKVRQVTEPTPVEADHVYVIPPGVDLTMNDGYLRVSRDGRNKGGPHVAIDIFFRTLAQVHRERAVCVVMSGTGSDGAVGLTRVKEMGGISIAQSPDDAQHDGMPRAAIATGMVDFVLPAVEIGERLIELWSNAQQIRLPDAKSVSPKLQEPPDEASRQSAEQALQEVIGLLHSYTRHDFRHYKRATVLRRIERRMQVNRLADLPAYLRYLKEHTEEAVPLLQDMLISVTNFFRDREAFEAFEREALPRLVGQKEPGDAVRVWVPGCATGEEAYSISMLLREQADVQSKLLDIQIFATDIDERAIATARRGLYPEGIVEDVTPTRLRQFFTREQSQYRVAKAVREPVLFAVHNLLRDPPFSRLDFICCRNLLIYLDREAQARVLELFRISLRPAGYLFLGTSESTEAAGDLFIPVDKKNRIFRVNPNLAPSRPLPLIGDAPMERTAGSIAAAERHAMRAERPSFTELHQRALEQYAPPSVLIDQDHTALHLSNGVGRFLERPSGEPSDNLLVNVREDLRLELRTALFKAAQTKRSVETRLPQKEQDGRHFYLNIIVRPLPTEWASSPLTLVVFDEVEESMRPGDGDPPDSARAQLIGQLEDEIRQLKLHLQVTIEGAETSTEELKASNEELQAINEELRSATEELETSKEELQSMNEELVTVNYELKVKVEERGHINDDLQNLISSSEIATVFVDRGMRVKRYTPQASQLFNLIASDIGRSLFDITSQLDYPELAEDTSSAFKDLRSSERHIRALDGRHFLARVLPYRTAEDRIEGAILNFFDITALRTAEERARVGEEQLKVVAATTRDFAIITTDKQGIVETWNAGAQRIFGFSAEEMVGESIAKIFTSEDQENGVPAREMRIAAESGRAEDERWHRRKDGSRFYCSGVMTPLDGSVGPGFAKIARDMTGSKRQELAQEHRIFKEKKASLTAQAANELKDRFLAVMSHELKQPLNLIQMNVELLTRLPATAEHPKIRQIGETIKRAVGSQSQIINDLLDLSRIRTGKLRLNRIAVDVSELVQNLANAAISNFPGKHFQLEVVAAAPHITCVGDRTRIEQIVWNLLSNAAKFTPDGGRIAVSVDEDGDQARVVVADSGCGIAPENMSHVFGMFNQADNDANASAGGLGIGLALVQELTHAHGGRVEVESEGIDKGSRFSVWLPLHGSAVPAPANSTAEVELRNLRVLAVDDHLESLAPFAEVLRLEGAIVDVAESAKAGLELLASNTYDLLISDLGMPEMDGYEFISEIRRRPGAKKLVALAMSGFGRRADARRALAAGFDAHVPKPAGIEDIKAALQGL
jgi:two-component system CheB/CheR fusion protein